MHINIEFKAKTNNLLEQEQKLLTLQPRFVGEDHQKDTYFRVEKGRLKLREGNIENSLIHYERQNLADVKQSDILLYTHAPDENLKAILMKTLGVKIIVDKIRRIYFIENVKFHFDTIADLGTFVEVEAIDSDGSISVEKLQAQCEFYADFLGVKKSDYMAISYSDMLDVP
jgi:adenylate cyclase, class 2